VSSLSFQNRDEWQKSLFEETAASMQYAILVDGIGVFTLQLSNSAISQRRLIELLHRADLISACGRAKHSAKARSQWLFIHLPLPHLRQGSGKCK
jgi:hypothetical protein